MNEILSHMRQRSVGLLDPPSSPARVGAESGDLRLLRGSWQRGHFAPAIWKFLSAFAFGTGALNGANAAVVGILLAAFYHPVWTAAINSSQAMILALAAFCANLENAALVARNTLRGWRSSSLAGVE